MMEEEVDGKEKKRTGAGDQIGKGMDRIGG